MSYDIATRLDYLGERMPSLNDNALVYTRDYVDVEIERFTPQKINVDELAAYGISLLTEKCQDFVFNTASLSAFDPPLPQRNDRLTWDDRVYEVFSINEELYNFTTSTRKRIRVHARQVE